MFWEYFVQVAVVMYFLGELVEQENTCPTLRGIYLSQKNTTFGPYFTGLDSTEGLVCVVLGLTSWVQHHRFWA